MITVNSKKALLTTLAVLLLSVMLFPSLCNAATVGVQVGDWFMYEGELVLWEADEGVPFPPSPLFNFMKMWNESDWQKRTVANVSGTTITYEILTHYKNGTEETTTMDEDVTSASTLYAIGADLEPGDQVRPPTIGSAMIINATIEREYEGTTRETNYCEWTATVGTIYTHDDLYWDKTTGILVEFLYNGSISLTAGNATYSLTQKLTESGVWVVPEPYTWTVMLLMATACTVSLVLYKRRRLFIKT